MINNLSSILDRLFVCIGAQKAGTTWLNHVLADHPELSFPVVKEVHYFDYIYSGGKALIRRRHHIAHDLESTAPIAVRQYKSEKIRPKEHDLYRQIHFAFETINDDWYVNLFNGERIAADITPAYALLPENGFTHMRRMAKGIKVVFIMRNPVDRILSQVRYKYSDELRIYQGKAPRRIHDVPEEELLKDVHSPGVVLRSDYIQTIHRIFKVFDHRQILMLFYEELCDDPEKFISRVCGFLNITTGCIEKSRLSARINQGLQFEFPRVVYKAAQEQCRPVVQAMQEIVPDLPVEWLID